MATNVSTTNHTGEDYATISAWESDTEGALGGDIEILEIYNDDDSGIITVGTSITLAGATGVSATAYRHIRARSGDGWEGDLNATNPVTLNLTTDWGLIVNEDYFRIEGLRFTGSGNYYTIDGEADNLLIARCLFDGRSQQIRGIVADNSPASSDGVFTRCVAIDVEYGFLFYNGDWELTNCTVISCDYGIASYNAATCKAINNIALDCTTTDYYSGGSSFWASGSGYNIGGSSTNATPPNHRGGRSSTDSTSPSAGDWVMFQDLTASSEDLRLQDHAENDAIDYGSTLTGEAVTDAYGNDASGDWECGAFNFAAAAGVENDITISSSVDLNHATEPQRWRDRVTGDNFSLNDRFVLELITSYVINSIMISSDLTMNDGTGIQRWRDRIPSSTMDLGSTTWVARERSRLVEDAMALGSSIGQQLQRFRQLETPFDVYDVMDGVYRQRNQLLSSHVSLESRTLVARALDRAIFSTLNLYDLLSTEDVEGLFNFAVARVNVPTDTTTIDITTSNFGGDIPKAAIIILTEAVTNTTEATHNQLSIGFCDGSSQGYVRTQSVSGEVSAIASRRFFSNAVMSRTTPGNTDAGITASFDSFIADGVRLTASSTYGSGFLVHAIFFGGSACEVDVGISDSHLSGNTTSVTDPGFEPDIVFFAYCSNNAGNADINNSSHSFGVAVNDGSETQRAIFHHVGNGSNPAQTQGGLYTDSVLRHGTNEKSELISFDANGFTLEATGIGNPDESLYLALKLDNGFFDLQTYTAPDAISDVTVDNLDFRPEALIMAMIFVETANTLVTSGGGGPFGVYMADGTEEYTSMVRDRDNVSPTESASRSQNKIRFDGHTGSSGYAGTLTSFDAGGFTHNYTAANNNNRLWWALSLAGPETARLRARELLSTLILFDALNYTTLQFLLNAVTLHSQLELEDSLKVDRDILRLCESFVALYEDLKSERQRDRRITDTLDVYDDILQDAIKVLSDILLHDNLELTHKTIVAIQRLFKPIGVVIYGLDKARIEYAVYHGPGKIEYELKHREGIVYRLRNIKGETQYH